MGGATDRRIATSATGRAFQSLVRIGAVAVRAGLRSALATSDNSLLRQLRCLQSYRH